MQLYSYTARSAEGELVKGKVEARDSNHAAVILHERKLVIVKISEANRSSLSLGSGRIKSQDLVAFTQQLSTMINSGLPLTDALNLLQSQSSSAFAKIIGKVLGDIEGGSTLADALSQHKSVFSPVYLSLVRAGEAAGKLDDVLTRLAENEEKKREFSSKVKGAMVYPVIVLIAMVAVMVIMLVFVVPQLSSLYDDLGAELPMITQVIIGLSNFLIRFWWLVSLLIFGGIYMLRLWYKTETGRKKLDEYTLRMPLVGPLVEMMILTEFARTMALLLKSGISILEAIDIVRRAMNNVIYQEALVKAAQGVEKGVPMAAALAQQRVFPALMAQMMTVGEETGKVDEILFKVAQYYEKEAEHRVKNLTTAMEPLIMIVMGIGVGFLVFSIIMPIYNLTSLF